MDVSKLVGDCQHVAVSEHTFNKESNTDWNPDNREIRILTKHVPAPVSAETSCLLDRFQNKQALVKEFHNTPADSSQKMTPTPLKELPILAKELGIGRLLVKDEGERMGLKAFKGVGVGFALNQEIQRLGHEMFFRGTNDQESLGGGRGRPTITTMTDGNHGRAVAHIARKLDCDCIIFVPKNMPEDRKNAISNEGAEVVVVQGNYDDAIETVKEQAKVKGWHLISDTAWPGYEEIPSDIAAGYGTIFREVEEEMVLRSLGDCSTGASSRPNNPITHLLLQCGVGGFASAGVAYAFWNSPRWQERLRSLPNAGKSVWSDRLQILTVEPTDADCILENAKKWFQGKNYLRPEAEQNVLHGMCGCTGQTDSVMGGLNCGYPSFTAWPILRDLVDAYVAIGDKYAKAAVCKMYSEGIVSGESGAACVGAIMGMREECKKTGLSREKADGAGELKHCPFEFDMNSVVLVVSTEADTDTQIYRKILEEGGMI